MGYEKRRGKPGTRPGASSRSHARRTRPHPRASWPNLALTETEAEGGSMTGSLTSESIQSDGYLLPPVEKIQKVLAALAEYYGDLEWRPRVDPLSELILTILSQHTSDTNSFRAFDDMRQRYPTWEEVRAVLVDELADVIRSGGLANVKAPRIQEVLRQIGDERGELSLDFLYGMEPEEARAWLSRLPGVGPK